MSTGHRFDTNRIDDMTPRVASVSHALRKYVEQRHTHCALCTVVLCTVVLLAQGFGHLRLLSTTEIGFESSLTISEKLHSGEELQLQSPEAPLGAQTKTTTHANETQTQPCARASSWRWLVHDRTSAAVIASRTQEGKIISVAAGVQKS